MTHTPEGERIRRRLFRLYAATRRPALEAASVLVSEETVVRDTTPCPAPAEDERRAS